MKLWLDDVRKAPEGWKWARTNQAAIELLTEHECDECSLDHDLGLDNLDVEAGEHEDWDKIIEITYALGQAPREETGLDLVDWMIAHDKVPPKITIHSWNPDGAARMAQRFAGAGHDCIVAPFKP